MNKILIHLLAWLPMIILAILNALIREWIFLDLFTEKLSYQLSTITLILIFTLYTWFISRRWPLESKKQAIIVGLAWCVLTIIFETGLGFAGGQSTEELLAAYDIAGGNLWPLVPVSLAVLPWVMFRLKSG
jgi:hypothetical protein